MKRIAAALAIALSGGVAQAGDASYFVYDGNPVSAKVVDGRLVHLPRPTFTSDVTTYGQSEAVAALMGAATLHAFAPDGHAEGARLGAPHELAYGQAMFDVEADGWPAASAHAILAWSGPAQFERVAMRPARLPPALRARLVKASRRAVEPVVDLRDMAGIGRRLTLAGPIAVHDHGHPAGRPWLDIVDITWHIVDLPPELADKSIDSWSEDFLVSTVYDRRRDAPVFVSVTNEGGVEDLEFVLFKAARDPGAPLLMGAELPCSDGADMLLMDLDHERYVPGSPRSVAWDNACFPAL